jgi:hypothetical protein
MRANKTTLIIPTLFAAALGLSGCVTSDLERAGLGAAAGGVAAAALDGNIATGILIGAAGGAVCDDLGVCR